MFLGAGQRASRHGTKNLEQLGGALARMPRTGMLLIVGAVALAALPPLNGFVSEWLLYIGSSAEACSPAARRPPLRWRCSPGSVSSSGARRSCFVRLVGTALLGEPRSEPARHAHESPVRLDRSDGRARPRVARRRGRARRGRRATSAPRPRSARRGTEARPRRRSSPRGTAQLAVCIALALWSLLSPRRSSGCRAASSAADATWDCGYAVPDAPACSTPAPRSPSCRRGASCPGRSGPRADARAGGPLPGSVTLSTRLRDPVTRRALRADCLGRVAARLHASPLAAAGPPARLPPLLVLVAPRSRSRWASLRVNCPAVRSSSTSCWRSRHRRSCSASIDQTKAAVRRPRRRRPLLQLVPRHLQAPPQGTRSSAPRPPGSSAPGRSSGSRRRSSRRCSSRSAANAAALAFAGDLVLFAYLFGLGRFFTVAAALDTGSAFCGHGRRARGDLRLPRRARALPRLAGPRPAVGLAPRSPRCSAPRLALDRGPSRARRSSWCSSASSSCCSPRTAASRSTTPTRTSS